MPAQLGRWLAGQVIHGVGDQPENTRPVPVTDSGVTVFNVAFSEWISTDDKRSFHEITAHVFDELAIVTRAADGATETTTSS